MPGKKNFFLQLIDDIFKSSISSKDVSVLDFGVSIGIDRIYTTVQKFGVT